MSYSCYWASEHAAADEDSTANGIVSVTLTDLGQLWCSDHCVLLSLSSHSADQSLVPLRHYINININIIIIIMPSIIILFNCETAAIRCTHRSHTFSLKIFHDFSMTSKDHFPWPHDVVQRCSAPFPTSTVPQMDVHILMFHVSGFVQTFVQQ